ncbi:GNAT family N-acetyltransferase [Acidovorax sp. Leaf160]|uniref:GNAT family N-acetyltransferase n=1 Tax=Acidovorax sp. Leaf160 TaxID=1736280 RepID=UPI000AF869F8|nr:GNAT family N-acetyltransferase [Acidovorax sp. Leaf160]
MSSLAASARDFSFLPREISWILRPLCAADLPVLLAVQRACYGDGLIESDAVYARRLASPAQRSLALVAGTGGAGASPLLGYLAAYRSTLGQVTPLHGDFGGSPASDADSASDILYLHDMAVLPAFHGRGLAQRLLAAAWQGARAEGLHQAALVSVQGTQAFWARQGFAVRDLPGAAQRQRLAGYGEGAVYMVRDGSG